MFGAAGDEAGVDRAGRTFDGAGRGRNRLGERRRRGIDRGAAARKPFRTDDGFGRGDFGRGRGEVDLGGCVGRLSLGLGSASGASLAGLRWFLGLNLAPEPLPIRLAANPVGLLVLDARRMTLDPNTEGYAKVKRFLVGQAELACQLVNPDLLRQSVASFPSVG
jgi:hypothetical protein